MWIALTLREISDHADVGRPWFVTENSQSPELSSISRFWPIQNCFRRDFKGFARRTSLWSPLSDFRFSEILILRKAPGPFNELPSRLRNVWAITACLSKGYCSCQIGVRLQRQAASETDVVVHPLARSHEVRVLIWKHDCRMSAIAISRGRKGIHSNEVLMKSHIRQIITHI
jgi:hypothetical protein